MELNINKKSCVFLRQPIFNRKQQNQQNLKTYQQKLKKPIFKKKVIKSERLISIEIDKF